MLLLHRWNLSRLGVAAGEALGVTGLKETLVDLLIILKVKLERLLHCRLSKVGMAAGEALGLTVLEGILVALDLFVLKVKLERLSCLGKVAGEPVLKDAALDVLASEQNCQPQAQHLHIYLAH